MASPPSPLILVVNTGSTSTKVALFRARRAVTEQTARHPVEDLNAFRRLVDQAPMREAAVLDVLDRSGTTPADLDAVSCRGGLLAPLPSGTYRVGPKMLDDLRTGRYGVHASNLSAIIGARIADQADAPAFIVDPVVVDELCPEARYSGIPEIERRSIWHALNQKAVARRVAKKLGRRYEEANLIVVHLGGGTSVAAHRRGVAVDVNNALDGDGPFAVERSGGLPAADLVRLAYKTRKAELLAKITGEGGVVAYLGTNDLREVARRAVDGDEAARTVLGAMAYQVAKEVGACAAVLAGEVDAIAITGGAARCRSLVRRLRRRVRFLAPVHVVAGTFEMEALAEGALRVLTGEAPARDYR
ncbi:MAG: butyrate kinase [Planctomycetota bacterium]